MFFTVRIIKSPIKVDFHGEYQRFSIHSYSLKYKKRSLTIYIIISRKAISILKEILYTVLFADCVKTVVLLICKLTHSYTEVQQFIGGTFPVKCRSKGSKRDVVNKQSLFYSKSCVK